MLSSRKQQVGFCYGIFLEILQQNRHATEGYEYTDIERKTGHSGFSVQRYLSGFSKAIRFYSRGYSLSEIRQLADMSERLTQDYLDLYETFKDQPESQIRLQQILSEPLPSKKSLIPWNGRPGTVNP